MSTVEQSAGNTVPESLTRHSDDKPGASTSADVPDKKKGKLSWRQRKKAAAKQRSAKQDNWERTVTLRENRLWEKFYQSHPQIIPESEWNDFLQTMKSDLPHAFRLSGNKYESDVLLKLMKERYFDNMIDLDVDGEKIEPPKELVWYPDHRAYQMSVSKKTIRKSQVLESFHSFLITETELGEISRQEAVSMIPPLLLDVHPDHMVLDMCAAPGSKTAQIIEMLHSDSSQLVPKGLVIANDFENKRCYLLVHQSLKRVQSPCCIVTNHDASIMPNIKYCQNDKSDWVNLQFDRILCDVPCSGDGTLRKNIDIWRSWNPNSVYNLNYTQVRIAKRGLNLLKPGGLLVYSTCSLNPVEDEAVISELLSYGEGFVELVDVSEKLPGLRRSPGVYTWRIMDRSGNFYTQLEDIPKKELRGISAVRSVNFPPSLEKAQDYHLERCLRILPHHQNTGGFFVAVLRKTANFPWIRAFENPVDPPKTSNDNSDELKSPPRKKPKEGHYRGYKEDPFVFIGQNDPIWPPLRQFFAVSDDFPHTQLLGRVNDEDGKIKKRNLYFVNRAVKCVMTGNEDNLKIINAGLRMFSRLTDGPGEKGFRLGQEGLEILLPYLGTRVTDCQRDDAISILKSPKSRLLTELTDDLKDRLEKAGEGSHLMRCSYNGQTFCFCGWRGQVSLGPYVSVETRLHILRMLDADTCHIEQELTERRKQGNRKHKKTEDEGQADAVDGVIDIGTNVYESHITESNDDNIAVVEPDATTDVDKMTTSVHNVDIQVASLS